MIVTADRNTKLLESIDAATLELDRQAKIARALAAIMRAVEGYHESGRDREDIDNLFEGLAVIIDDHAEEISSARRLIDSVWSQTKPGAERS